MPSMTTCLKVSPTRWLILANLASCNPAWLAGIKCNSIDTPRMKRLLYRYTGVLCSID
jgi:hypothetical protein